MRTRPEQKRTHLDILESSLDDLNAPFTQIRRLARERLVPLTLLHRRQHPGDPVRRPAVTGRPKTAVGKVTLHDMFPRAGRCAEIGTVELDLVVGFEDERAVLLDDAVVGEEGRDLQSRRS